MFTQSSQEWKEILIPNKPHANKQQRGGRRLRGVVQEPVLPAVVSGK